MPAYRPKGESLHAQPVRADLCRDSGDDLEQQPRAVLLCSAIGVGAPVGAVLEELLDQVAVGGLDFDPVESGRDGVGGRLPEVADDARKLLRIEGAGDFAPGPAGTRW